MSDFSYRWTRRFFYPLVWVCSRPLALHCDRAAIPGGYILAATHLSPLDTPLLMRHTPRNLDFMSVVEMKRNRFVRAFFSLFNTFYLDRSRKDPATVLTAVRRLQNGRVIAMFPEGNLRTGPTSVLNGGKLKSGIERIADLADVPVVPVVVLGGSQFHRVKSWLPIMQTRYGIIYGHPMRIRRDLAKKQAASQFLTDLAQSLRDLGVELESAMKLNAPNLSIPSISSSPGTPGKD